MKADKVNDKAESLARALKRLEIQVNIEDLIKVLRDLYEEGYQAGYEMKAFKTAARIHNLCSCDNCPIRYLCNESFSSNHDCYNKWLLWLVNEEEEENA